MGKWLDNWRQRHLHPANRALHAVGIPVLIAGLVLLAVQLVMWRWDLWWRPAALNTISSLQQWTGHRLEGNDLGELILIKKLLGRPYVDVAPRDQDAPERCHP